MFEKQKQRTEQFQNESNEKSLKLTSSQNMLTNANKIVRHKEYQIDKLTKEVEKKNNILITAGYGHLIKGNEQFAQTQIPTHSFALNGAKKEEVIKPQDKSDNTLTEESCS